MRVISLNEAWSYSANGVNKTVDVPFSHLPVGRSLCQKRFAYSGNAERVFIKFDGITYWARVTLNGNILGEMLPYCEYYFDVTELIGEDNLLSVELEDVDRKFGPTEGWENFGGIIRDVSLVLRPKNYIKDVFFHSTLDSQYSSAKINVEIECEESRGDIEISLFDGDERVLSYTQSAGQTKTQQLSGVKLWSPSSPYLYRLEVTLGESGSVSDSYSCEVGFRDISIDRHRFLLNGEPLFLGGVCKHEMVGNSGHCPTDEQIEADLRQIKSMGCNFVRLVHYPHNKKTLEIADRIGLLVSEEPGLWWSDTSDSEVASGSLEVLKRTVIRDRNHPSVVFWLCFNECMFTESFLRESAEVCRKYDPTRLVSGANCMSIEETLLHYNKCGFDFYTMHPYAPTFDRAMESAKALCDKPLVFTEWGGYFLYNNPHLLTDFMSEMNRLYMQSSDEGALAGAFFWFFAELNDFNRGEPACTDGVLHEGLVDSERRPTLIYDSFCENIKRFGKAFEEKEFWIERAEGFDSFEGRNILCAKQGREVFESYFAKIKDAEAKRNCMRPRILKKGPIFADGSAPALLSKDTPLIFEREISAEKITLVGLTMLEGGYPLGEYGAEIAELSVEYNDGQSERVALRNGEQVTTAFTLNGSSRIDPRARDAVRFCEMGYDKNFERYAVNRLDIPTDGERVIKRITLRSTSESPLLLYAMVV